MEWWQGPPHINKVKQFDMDVIHKIKLRPPKRENYEGRLPCSVTEPTVTEDKAAAPEDQSRHIVEAPVPNHQTPFKKLQILHFIIVLEPFL